GVGIIYKGTHGLNKSGRVVGPKIRERSLHPFFGGFSCIQINRIALIYRLRNQLILHLENKKGHIIIETFLKQIPADSYFIVDASLSLELLVDTLVLIGNVGSSWGRKSRANGSSQCNLLIKYMA